MLFALLCMTFAPRPVDAAGLEFDRIQEEWVAEAVPGDLPPIVKMLGAKKFADREFAQDCLRLLGRPYLGHLTLATRSRDAEVRQRAESLINRLYRCPDCGGTGLCFHCWGRELTERHCGCDYHRHCPTCKGGGDLRVEVHFTTIAGFDRNNENIWVDTYRLRNLFPKEKN